MIEMHYLHYITLIILHYIIIHTHILLSYGVTSDTIFPLKESQEKEYARLHVTIPLFLKRVLAITNMHVLSISHVFDLLVCMHVQLLLVENIPSIL